MKPRPPLPIRAFQPFPWDVPLAAIVQPIRPDCTAEDLEIWLLARIAEELKADPLGIDPTLPPAVYGLAAAPAKAVTRDLARCLGRRLRENVFDSAHGVRGVAQRLADGPSERPAPRQITREDMRRELLARAVRSPRCALAAGERPRRGRAGGSPPPQSGFGALRRAALG